VEKLNWLAIRKTCPGSIELKPALRRKPFYEIQHHSIMIGLLVKESRWVGREKAGRQDKHDARKIGNIGYTIDSQ